MERNLQQNDRGTLKTLYDREVERLNTLLLSGASWEETADQRRLVTELSIAMSRHISPLRPGNPAEHRTRDKEIPGISPA